MRKPHVNNVSYKLETDEEYSYVNCPPIDYENDLFSAKLADGILTFIFKQHYDLVDKARAEVENLLKTWEIDAALKYGRGKLKFKYLDAEVIDLDPPPPGTVYVETAAIGMGLSCSATVHITSSKYPEIPNDFEANPDVETLWQRYEIYLDGREPLLSLGYFFLSYLEYLSGGRDQIQNIFLIEKHVMRKLGELTSLRGDRLTARKGKGHSFQPITKNEKIWVEECIKKIIRRLGEHQKDPSTLIMITMNDLPLL